MIELLAPCGNRESFYAAINHGADAVYLGLDDFSARKNADNFSRENLKEYLDYAHIFGVKVFVALNTLIKDTETQKFLDYIGFCNDIGVDGVILQNLFWGKILHNAFPQLALHLSTQAGVNNVDGAIIAKDFGFSRVVLARETPLSEIQKISEIIETECFVQGALCTAFSGQCYLSGFAGNLSGNRGLCKQPCRKKYTLTGDSEKREGYLLSLADLSIGDKINDYISAGVTSFKIEGRMRKPSYVSAATSYYRSLLNGKNPPISPLTRTFNRGDYTKGLAFGQDKNFISDMVQGHKGEFVGKVSSIKNGYANVDGKTAFGVGDGFKILRNGIETGSLLCDKNGLKLSGDVRTGDGVYITTDTNLENTLLYKKRLLPVAVTARFNCGNPPYLSATANGLTVEVNGSEPLQAALSAPIDKNKIIDNLSKTDIYPFGVTAEVETDGVFLPVSKLNALRRELYEKLFARLAETPDREKHEIVLPDIEPVAENGLIVLSDSFDFDCKTITHAVLCPTDYADNGVIDGFFKNLENCDCQKYLYIPNKFSSQDEAEINSLFNRFDGLYVEGFFGINLAKRYNKKLILGTGANVYDNISLSQAKEHCETVCLSKELSIKQAQSLNGYYYSAGAIKVMDLLYCTFKKTCGTCKRGDIFTLSDGERSFTLRRIKLNGCRFELYNGANLVTANGERAVVNLIGISPDKKAAVIKNLGDKDKLKTILAPYTSGHENKPLI